MYDREETGKCFHFFSVLTDEVSLIGEFDINLCSKERDLIKQLTNTFDIQLF